MPTFEIVKSLFTGLLTLVEPKFHCAGGLTCIRPTGVTVLIEPSSALSIANNAPVSPVTVSVQHTSPSSFI